MIGPWQIVIIALVILVLFGASRLGEIGKGLGEGISNFKKGVADDGKDKELPVRDTTGEAVAAAQKEGSADSTEAGEKSSASTSEQG
ncbi:MAG: twin-arginine translocase TatA/TatE family subunit [Polyangiaceae bacterium]|nr:twin-arginine translocase TatA/TatE family subunit [Polyangiaceae bacterium]